MAHLEALNAGEPGGESERMLSAGELGEFDLIARILGRTGSAGESVLVGAGDDTAALRVSPGAVLLATCDSLVEGRHFLRGQITPDQLGRRLAAVNLSDIAAMGGQPRWALSSFVLPQVERVSFIEEMARGLATELRRFGADVVGGNLASGEQLILDLTLLGETVGGRIIRRSGAREGDALLVTGDLGASAAGRAALDASLRSIEADEGIGRHLTPEPRVRAGQMLAAAGVSAMIDISDGLAQDLGHLCDASGVGALLEEAWLPISAATRWVAATLGQDPSLWALGGGEDYELLCTVETGSVPSLKQRLELATGVSLTRIGTIVSHSAGRQLHLINGHTTLLDAPGWQHFGHTGGRRP